MISTYLWLAICLIVPILLLVGGGVMFVIEDRRRSQVVPSAPEGAHEVKLFGVIGLRSNRTSLILIGLGLAGFVLISLPLIKGGPQALGLGAVQETNETALTKLQKRLPSADRTGWTVSLTSCLVLPEEHTRILHVLEGLGFAWVANHSHLVFERTPNLAAQDTIYYYHSSTKDVAEIVGKLIQNEIGRPISIARGDGAGVPSDRVASMLVVHRIGDDCRGS